MSDGGIALTHTIPGADHALAQSRELTSTGAQKLERWDGQGYLEALQRGEGPCYRSGPD